MQEQNRTPEKLKEVDEFRKEIFEELDSILAESDTNKRFFNDKVNEPYRELMKKYQNGLEEIFNRK